MGRQRSFIGPSGMGGMVSLWGASSLIRLVQSGTIVIAAASNSNTATVTSVDTANAVLVYLGESYVGDTSADLRFGLGRLSLTNATTVTFERANNSGAATLTGSYAIVEFAPGVIRSVQRGTIAMASFTGNTATITAVNTAKSSAMYLGSTTNTLTLRNENYLGKLVLTDGTTVSASRGSSSDNLTLGYQVVELY